MIAVADIETGKILGLSTFIKELSDEGKWISILDCNFVKTAVIDAQP